MAYGTTTINGASLIVNGALAPDPIPLNTPFSIRVWVSVRMDAPSADILTLHLGILAPDGSTISTSVDKSIAPGEGYQFPDIGPFNPVISGPWIITLILDSALDGAGIFTIGLSANVAGETPGPQTATQRCTQCKSLLKITYTVKTGYYPVSQYFTCPVCGAQNTCSAAWDIISIEKIAGPPPNVLPILAMAAAVAFIVVVVAKKKR